jgi:hypothetical protein
MGFFPYHIGEQCRAPDHPTLQLPHLCAIDHYLEPLELDKSPYLHRERSFLDNPRAPTKALHATALKVRVCGGGGGPSSVACENATATAGEYLLPARLRISQLRARLGGASAKLLKVDDVLTAFGGFDHGFEEGDEAELVQYHEDLQAIISSWCCTIDERFKRVAGVIPFLLPPLEGQTAWRGATRLAWAAEAVAQVFETAGDTARARSLRPHQR